MRLPVALGELAVGLQPGGHVGHQALRLQAGAGRDRPRAGQVVGGRERCAVGQPRPGGDHRRLAARAAVRDPGHTARRTLQLGGDRRLVRRRSWAPAHRPFWQSPARCRLLGACRHAGAGVAVVGSINADLTVFASPLPRPGETVIGDSFSMVLGGKGANQALAAVRAGAPTFMIGAVGEDPFADLTLDTLAAAGVDVAQCRGGRRADRDRPHPGRHRLRPERHRGGAAREPPAEPDGAETALRALAGAISVVLVQLEIPVDVVARGSRRSAASSGLRLILDPAPAQPLPDGSGRVCSWRSRTSRRRPSMTGVEVRDTDSAVEAGRWFLDRGVAVAVITLGAKGAVVVRRDQVDVLDRSRSRSSTPPPPATRSPGPGRRAGRRPAAAGGAAAGPWRPQRWRSPYAGPAQPADRGGGRRVPATRDDHRSQRSRSLARPDVRGGRAASGHDPPDSPDRWPWPAARDSTWSGRPPPWAPSCQVVALLGGRTGQRIADLLAERRARPGGRGQRRRDPDLRLDRRPESRRPDRAVRRHASSWSVGGARRLRSKRSPRPARAGRLAVLLRP